VVKDCQELPARMLMGNRTCSKDLQAAGLFKRGMVKKYYMQKITEMSFREARIICER